MVLAGATDRRSRLLDAVLVRPLLRAGAISDATGHRPVELAPLASIAVAAAVTSTLRVGCRVFACDFHHPVVLAKEFAPVVAALDGG